MAIVKEVPKTDQEAFDHVVRHLVEQRNPAKNLSTGACYYRFNGLACAIGSLIPDENYTANIENNPADTIAKYAGLGHLNFHLLNDLQTVHDETEYENREWETVAEHLKIVAKEFNLSSAVVDEEFVKLL